MIIDGHAHVTRAAYGGIDALTAIMDAHGIDRAVLFPGGMIDVRKMSRYVTGEESAGKVPIVNDLVEELFRARPDRFYGFYCIDPTAGGDGPDELRRAVERGFVGLKLAPIVHKFGLGDPAVLDLAAACGELSVPLYTHVVYGDKASTGVFALLAQRFPQTTFVLGHMGCGPADVEAIEVARRLDNVLLETSGGSFLIVKMALERLGAQKLIYGSEFPMHHPHVELEKVRLAAPRLQDFEQATSKTLLSILDRAPITVDRGAVLAALASLSPDLH
jgi:predicted TIM-barrel fold metal-dependent hydrolase